MRKMLLVAGAIASAALGLGGVTVMRNTMDVFETAAPQPKPLKQAPQGPAMTVEQRRSAADAIYRHSSPAKHKNRAGGERAHRRWRKRRSGGKS